MTTRKSHITHTHPMERRRHNLYRLALYHDLFDAILAGTHNEGVAVNLLIDIRWMEVARALTNTLHKASLRGPIRPLAADICHLFSKAAVSAGGTSAHAELPSWFLQNNESFLCSCLHKLLVTFTQQMTTAPLQMQIAFAALIDIADGLKPFLGLPHLALSTGAHALMSVAANSRYDFLTTMHANKSAATLCFAELLAEHILEESKGDEHKADSPLLYFAQSKRWQIFAAACIDCFTPNESFARLCRLAKVTLEAPKKDAPRLFCLASAFLDAGAQEIAEVPASPEPLKRTTETVVKTHKTPIKVCRSAIRKRSVPFVKLVQRLLATSGA